MKILLVGPIFSDNNGTLSTHAAERGIYDALVQLGHNTTVWDHRHGIWMGEKREKYDIVLCVGPGIPKNIHEKFKTLKGHKILYSSEPIRLECYKNKLLENRDFFDFFFTFDESEIILYNNLGIKNVSFLPQGYSPKFYKPINAEFLYDLCFVGSINNEKWCNREYFLNRIRKSFPQTHILTGVFDAEKVNRIYNCHKLILNLGLYCPQSGPPEDLKAFGWQQRIFEAVGAGRVVVTNEIPAGTNEFFTDKKDILFYNKDNLEDVIRYGLEHYREMEENILKIRNQHTYKARMRQMLEILEKD